MLVYCVFADSPPPPPSGQGVVVKADYVPLLQSLAPYGWRLMCVLPTPIVKTNRYRCCFTNWLYELLSVNWNDEVTIRLKKQKKKQSINSQSKRQRAKTSKGLKQDNCCFQKCCTVFPNKSIICCFVFKGRCNIIGCGRKPSLVNGP